MTKPTLMRSLPRCAPTAALMLLLVACGTNPSSGGTTPPATYLTDGQSAGDGAAGDVAADAGVSDTSPADTAAPQDTGVADSGADTSFPDGFLEPLDSGVEDTGPAKDAGGPVVGPIGKLYAHTATDLYELDLKLAKFKKKGTFKFDKHKDKITDIAVDKFGTIYAIGFDHVYTCSATDAACTWLAKLPSSFNGMTFVPEGVVTPGKDALIGISSKGEWTHIAIDGTTVKLKKLGTYGGGWLSSGDAFSVVGIGTFATLKGKGKSDSLARINPKTGKIEKIIGETGAEGLFGLAWWAGVFYGFSKGGKVYTLDTSTGKATEVKSLQAPKGVSWWGAGVSTRANGG